MKIISNKEWMNVLYDIEGFKTFQTLLTALAEYFENDQRANADHEVCLQPLTKKQASIMRAGFIDYFAICPRDWEYVSESEMLENFDAIHYFHPDQTVEGWYLSVDFSIPRSIAKAKLQIKAEAVERRERAAVANFKTDMYIVDAQHQREQQSKPRRSQVLNRIR